jgi:UDP-glucuronate decarboxylase
MGAWKNKLYYGDNAAPFNPQYNLNDPDYQKYIEERFTYVDDLVYGLIRLMNADGVYDPVNLGNPQEFTISELAEEVALATGVELRVSYKPLPADDPRQRKPDITRAIELLKWQPCVSLTEGLRPTVAYFTGQVKKRSIVA